MLFVFVGAVDIAEDVVLQTLEVKFDLVFLRVRCQEFEAACGCELRFLGGLVFDNWSH